MQGTRVSEAATSFHSISASSSKPAALNFQRGEFARSRQTCFEAVTSPIVFIFKRDLQLGAIGLNLPIGDLHVELNDLRDAKIAQGLRGSFDSRRRCLLPGFRACSDEFDNFVNALGHSILPCSSFVSL